MKYIVQWRYRSSLGGEWQAGDVVSLDRETAALINRDSPGVLVEVPAASDGVDAAYGEATEARQAEAPPQDRQVKRPAQKR